MNVEGPNRDSNRAQWEAEMKELRVRLAEAEAKAPKPRKREPMDPEDVKWHKLVLFLIVAAVATLMCISFADDGDGDKRKWSVIIPCGMGLVGYAIALLAKEYK